MKRMAAILAALAVLWLLPVEGRSLGFGVSGSREGERLSVQVEYDGAYGRVSVCVFRVIFESELVDFVGTREIEDGYLVSTVDGGILQTVYSSWSDSGGLESVEFEFKPRKGADTAAIEVEARVEQVAAQEEVPELPPVKVEYEGQPRPGSEAKLLTLKPDNGELEPEFSPEITEYEVSVPYEVEELNFGMSASAGAKVSVNRRKLGSGGSDTLFRLTVTAEDGVTKQVYMVNVHRGEYAAPTPKPSASPKAEKTPGPSPAPKAAKTPVPRSQEALEPTEWPVAAGTPLTEVVTIEREKVSTFDRLAVLGGIFAGGFRLAGAGKYLFEKLDRRRGRRENENPLENTVNTV